MGTHPIFESDFDCLTDLRMDKLNKLADKLERSAEKLVDKIEDSLENAQDPPVVPMTTEKQLIIAIPTGALAGAVVGRASKPVALVAGTSVIAVAIATQMGVLEPVDRNQLNRDVRTARRQLDDHLRRNNLPSTNQMRQFFKKNQTLTIAGAGASLVSLAFKLK